MLTYDMTLRGNVPLYDYLYQCIRQDIIVGNLAPGEKLPSKRALARHLNVGVITVTNAYEQLLTEGYLTSVEKKGYYVENVSNYCLREFEPEVRIPEPEEREYFADFKANRNSLKNFPVDTWNRMMRATLSLRDPALFATVPYKGLRELRQAIADYLKRHRAMVVDPAQIIIGAGTEYLYGRLMQMFGTGCTFAMEDPGYKKFATISESYGNPWVYVPIDDGGLLVDRLEESGADVVHVSPANHFPTGIVMPITRRLRLFEWVNRKKGRYIIEDDYDSEFRYAGRFILPLYAEDRRKKVIYMNTFSKSLVPSLRISYMVLPPNLLERYEETMSFYSCTVSSFEQMALARFINEGYFERHLNRMRKYYGEQRGLILAALERSRLMERARIVERKAGTHFLLEVGTDLSEEEVRQRGLAQDLSLSLYSDYSFAPREKGKVTLIINYAGIQEEKIGEVVRRLERIFLEGGSGTVFSRGGGGNDPEKEVSRIPLKP